MATHTVAKYISKSFRCYHYAVAIGTEVFLLHQHQVVDTYLLVEGGDGLLSPLLTCSQLRTVRVQFAHQLLQFPDLLLLSLGGSEQVRHPLVQAAGHSSGREKKATCKLLEGNFHRSEALTSQHLGVFQEP